MSEITRNVSPPRHLFTSKFDRKSRERRWTTGLEKGQLRIPFNDSLVADDSNIALSQDEPFNTSSSSLFSNMSYSNHSEFSYLRSPTPTAEFCSQQDPLQDLAHKSLLPEHVSSNHQYQLSYEIAIDNSPLSPSVYGPTTYQINHCHHVIRELVSTENKYVTDITDIIKGYFVPLSEKIGQLNVTQEDISKLFCNIEEIRSFHEDLFNTIQLAGYDYQKIGKCFIDKSEGFKIYTSYCNNYPELVDTLAKLSVDRGVSDFMKHCQQQCKHPLPLGAYLLKPVQRVVKYALLLRDLAKHLDLNDNGFVEVQMAIHHMTQVAEHINEMKRKYDQVVHVHEVQTLLSGWEGKELTKYGNIVLEDYLKWVHSKTGSTRHPSSALRSAKDSYVFLFQKVILIVKKKDKDEGYQYKYHVEVNDAQLTEHLKDPTCFQIRQISNKSTLTFQARSVEMKLEWSSSIKRLLMESVPGLPDKARKLILAGFTTDIHNLQDVPRSVTLDRRTLKSDSKNSSPLKNTHKTFITGEKLMSSLKPPLNLSLSMAQIASSTGGVESSTPTKEKSVSPSASERKDNFFPELTGENKKKPKNHSSLPRGLGVPWTRSDSDPNLMEAYDKKSENNQLLSQSLQNSPMIRMDSNINKSEAQSPDHVSSEESTPTPTNLELPESSTHSSLSSPDIHQTIRGLPENVSDSKRIDLLVNEGSNDIEGDYSILSSSSYSEALDTFNNSMDISLIQHLRSISAPLRQPSLETIHSLDVTPRGSVTDDHSSELSAKAVQSKLAILHVTHLSPVDDDADEEINTTTSNEEELLIEPPSGFAAVSQYTLDTNTAAQEECESDKHEMLFQQLMSSSSLSSASNQGDNEQSTLREIIQENEEDSPPQTPLIKVDVPEEIFKVNHVTSEGANNESVALKLISPEEIPPITPYERQTTPYTSIEDIPLTVDDQPSVPLPIALNDEDVVFGEDRDVGGSIKRWHSFQGHNRIKKEEQNRPSKSNISPPPPLSKKDKDKEKRSSFGKNETAGRFGVLLRHKSMSKSHTTPRPISLVGLVHSTRDDSDLLNLTDALAIELIKQRHNSNASTPLDTIIPPPLEFRNISTEVDTTESGGDKSPETSPTATSTATSTECTPSPTAKKHTRWSLLRSKLTTSKRSRSSDTTSARSSSPQTPEGRHSRIFSDPQIYDDGEKKGSLFAAGSIDKRRRSNKASKIKKHAEMQQDEDSSTAAVDKKLSKVKLLAREYSQRLKSKQDTPTPLLPNKPDEFSMSQTSVTSDTTTASAPRWLKALQDRRRNRSHTLSRVQNTRGIDDDDRLVSMASDQRPSSQMQINHQPLSLQLENQALSQPDQPSQPDHQTLSHTDNQPLSLKPDLSRQPLSQPTSPLSSPVVLNVPLASSQSFFTLRDKSQSPEAACSNLKSPHTNLQRFSSENILVQNSSSSYNNDESINEGMGVGTLRKQKKGWVKTLVSKFSSNK